MQCLLAIPGICDMKYRNYVQFVHANPCAYIVLLTAIKKKTVLIVIMFLN